MVSQSVKTLCSRESKHADPFASRDARELGEGHREEGPERGHRRGHELARSSEGGTGIGESISFGSKVLIVKFVEEE